MSNKPRVVKAGKLSFDGETLHLQDWYIADGSLKDMVFLALDYVKAHAEKEWASGNVETENVVFMEGPAQ